MPAMSRAFTAVLVCCFASVIVGYYSGQTGNAKFINDLQKSQKKFELLSFTFSFATLVSIMLAGQALNKFGRRPSLITAIVIFLLGRLLTLLAHDYVVFWLAEVVASVGVGCTMVVVPVFVVEISPAKSRGKLTSLLEFSFNGGRVVGCLADYFYPKIRLDMSWRLSVFSGTVTLLLLGMGFFSLPESPAWAVAQGRPDNAEEIPNDEIKIASGTGACDSQTRRSHPIFWPSVFRPPHVLAHLVLCALAMHILKQICGADALLYNPVIFSKVSLTDSVTESDLKKIMTLILSSIETLSNLVPVLLLDRMGRRLLILISLSGMSMSLVAVGIFLGGVENDSADIVGILSAVSYLAFFSIGLSPVSIVYISEMFPISLRSWGSAVCVSTSKGINIASSALLVWLFKFIGFRGGLCILAMLAAVMWVLFFHTLPETCGSNLEKIGTLFGGYTIRKTANKRDDPEDGK